MQISIKANLHENLGVSKKSCTSNQDLQTWWTERLMDLNQVESPV